MFRAIVLLTALLFALPCRADRITLRDGGVIEGRVTAETDREVTVEVLLNGKVVRIGLQAERIESRERSVSTLEAYEAELKKADPKSADAMADLAAWCLERKWVEKAETHLRAALLRVPDHKLGGRLASSLGWTREGDRWQTEAERMQAQGLEKSGDRWVTKEEAARLRQDEMDRRQEAQQATDRQGVESHLKRAEAAFARARKELDGAQASVEQAERQRGDMAVRKPPLEERIGGLQGSENALRREIDELEAWLRLRAPCDCADPTRCPHDPARCQAALDAAYRQLSRVRKDRREAERELAGLNESLRAQEGVLKARRETMAKAEQAAQWREAEVDRLKTKLAALR